MARGITQQFIFKKNYVFTIKLKLNRSHEQKDC